MPDSSREQPEYRWRGVHRAMDFADDVQTDWQTGIEKGKDTRWSQLNHHYLVKKKQWTVVSGIPSHGKSTWVDNLMVSLAEKHGWKFLVVSPENQPVQRHIESLVEIHSGKKFAHPNHGGNISAAITGDELGISTAFVNKHFCFVVPEETDFHIEYLLELAHQVKHDPVNPFDFDGMVLDPYNELEHKRPNQMSEVEYISWILGKVRRFVKTEDTHLWIVAHPTKLREVQQIATDVKLPKLYAKPSLYDIAGAAHWYNKCDMGVVVYRNVTQRPETTTIDVQKIRHRECGTKGEVDFYYDFLCNRLVETENELLYYRLRDK